MTICRSFGGKSVASTFTSAVNDEPSGVRVKLKKGTFGSLGRDVVRDDPVETDKGGSVVRPLARWVENICFDGDLYPEDVEVISE